MAGMTKEKREELIGYLVANCNCWKGEGELLKGFTDEKLEGLKAHVEGEMRMHEEYKKLGVVVNRVSQPFQHNGVIYQFDPVKGKYMARSANPSTPVVNVQATNEIPVATPVTTVTGNEVAVTATPATATPATATPATATPANATSGNAGSGRVMSPQEWMAMAPPEMQATWNYAQNLVKAERDRLVNELTLIANQGNQDPGRKELILSKLQGNPGVDVLKELLVLVRPVGVAVHNGFSPSDVLMQPNFAGAVGAPPVVPVVNRAGMMPEEEDILPIPVCNWGSKEVG